MSTVDSVSADLLEQKVPNKTGLGAGWLVRRVLWGLFTLWVVTTLVFVATQALPSDPARAILGRATPAQIDLLRHELHLDEPLISQYWNWLSGVVHGDLGNSLAAREPVTQLIRGALGNSLILLAITALIALPGGVALGFAAAVRRDRALDQVSMGGSLLFTALPEFVVALVLVILFSTTVFTFLPAVTEISSGESPLAQPEQLILPVATLVLASVPYIFRLARASMIEVLGSDYIAIARLKGLPERRVLWRHAAPNALIAPVQGSAIVLAYLLGGILVVEIVFSYPGLGTALIEAVNARDLPVIQGVTIVFAAAVVIFNFVADALTVFLTPKLRTKSR